MATRSRGADDPDWGPVEIAREMFGPRRVGSFIRRASHWIDGTLRDVQRVVDFALRDQIRAVTRCRIPPEHAPDWVTHRLEYTVAELGRPVSKVGSLYDYGRSDVYDVEHMFGVRFCAPHFDGLREFREWLIETVFEDEQFSACAGEGFGERTTIVHRDSDQKSGWYPNRSGRRIDDGEMRIAPHMRDAYVALHELGHVLVPAPHPPHGRLWRRVHRWLLNGWLPETGYPRGRGPGWPNPGDRVYQAWEQCGVSLEPARLPGRDPRDVGLSAAPSPD